MRWRTRLPAGLGGLTALTCLGLIALACRPLEGEPSGLNYVPPRGYVCYRAASPVTVDGRLDEMAWRDAPWTEEFVDIEGDRKPRPRFRTRVKMLWDDQFFYVAAEMEEPHVWGTLTEHDAVIFHDND